MSKSFPRRAVATCVVDTVAVAQAALTQTRGFPHRMNRMPGSMCWGALCLSLLLATPLAARFNGVQVNVDAFGNDILLDAANEPSIAVDPNDPNRIAIGWRQFNSISDPPPSYRAGVAYSTDGGLTWSASVLDPGNLRTDPVLDFDADGNFYYASLTNDDVGGVRGDSVDLFKSTDGGATWSSPVPAFGGDKEWLAIDRTTGIGRGNIYQNWLVRFPEIPDTSFTRSLDGAMTFEGPIAGATSYMSAGTMDVGPDGTLYLAGATLGERGHLFSKSTNAQDPTQTPSFTPSQPVSLGGTQASGRLNVNPGAWIGQVWVATDHSPSSSRGNVYLLSTVNPTGADPADVKFIRSTDQGDTWSDPIRVNNDSLDTNAFQWFGTMSVAPNGRIDAIWNDTRSDPTSRTSELTYAYSFDAGDTWLGNTPLSDPFEPLLGYSPNDNLGHYYDMISDNTGAYLAYAATFNGGQDVYFLRIDAVPAPSGSIVPEPASLELLAAVIMVVSLWHGRGRKGCRRLLVNRLAIVRTVACCLAVAAMLAQTPWTQAQVRVRPKFFRDTFEDMNLLDNSPVSWTGFFGEDLDASSGDLVLTPTDTLLGVADVDRFTYDDVSIRTQLRVNGEPFIDAGVFARFDGENNSYVASISSGEWPQAPNALVLSGYFGGGYEILQQAPTTLDPTQTDVMLQFDLLGEMLTLTAWTDGTPQQSISYQDNRLQVGTIGLEYDDGVSDFFFLEDHKTATFRFFEAAPELMADFDDDGDVDGFDFLQWQRGNSPDPLSAEDLADWEANYGTVASPIIATSSTVPEPATGITLIFGVALLVHTQRQRTRKPCENYFFLYLQRK